MAQVPHSRGSRTCCLPTGLILKWELPNLFSSGSRSPQGVTQLIRSTF
jgi:hypothetical protein